MNRGPLHRLPFRDPVSGGEMYVSELTNDETGVTIRGRFEVPRYARLDDEQSKFLETFLRCRGMINGVERELGISYPTVKARLESLLTALELTPIEQKVEKHEKNGAISEKRRSILDQLERGEITPEEAKQKMRA